MFLQLMGAILVCALQKTITKTTDKVIEKTADGLINIATRTIDNIKNKNPATETEDVIENYEI